MKINRKELLEKLKLIKPVLSNNSNIEDHSSFLFTGTEIITYNNDMSIGVEFESDFKCLIKADKFFDLVSNIDDDFIMVKITKGLMSVNSKKTKAKLVLVEGAEDDVISIIRPDKKIKWKKLPLDFMEGVGLCIFSAGRDMVKPINTCLYINKNTISSTDNLRLSQFKMKTEIEDTFLLSVFSAIELVKFKIIKYCVQEKWIFFKTDDNVIFCSRKMEGSFFKLDHVLNVEGKKFVLNKDIIKIIKVGSLFSDGAFNYDKYMDVEIKDNKIKCSSTLSSASVMGVMNIESDVSDMDIKFRINPDFFKTILEKINDVIYSDGGTSILFWNENFKHVIALYSNNRNK